MADHGHDAPSHTEHSAQNIVGEMGSAFTNALKETMNGLITPIAQISLDATVDPAKDLSIAASVGGSQPNKGGGGGGGGHH